MPIQSEIPAAVERSKLSQLLLKRLRQLLRVAFVLASCLALAAMVIAIWWLTSLNGLPDIGEPFDIAAFRDSSISDEQNAFTFLRRADEKLTPIAFNLAVSWSQADPKLHQWVEANRQALDLFQHGADQSDAAHPAGDPMVNGTRVIGLALLEGNGRQEGGDTAGAWDRYRAVLRMITHIRRRGSLHQRFDVNVYWSASLLQRLTVWAADQRTTVPQLRGALEEVLKTEPRPEWASFAIKYGYLQIMSSLEQPVNLFTRLEIEGDNTVHFGDMRLSPDMVASVDAARRFLWREPERSRRVVRLLCANWLADTSRKPAVRASISLLRPTNPVKSTTFSVPLYAVDPDASARSLPPQELAKWVVTTDEAKLRILVANRYGWPWPPDRLQDRRAHRKLVVMLATEIYHRERGSPPPSDEALVGTYLKSLPDDGSAELSDGTAPTVE
jgi:hypothetical protein